MNIIKKFIKKSIKGFNLYKKCCRSINLKKRLKNASPSIKDLVNNGFLILKWEDVFNESHKESELYKEMKNEAQKLNFTNTASYGSLKTNYLAKKYAQFESIKDGGLLKFCYSNEIASLIYQFFNSSYQIMSLDYWRTRAALDDKQRIASQNWHTDPEDALMLKIFVYFHKVSEKNGSTEIIKGTQVGGNNCFRKFPFKNLTGGYVKKSIIDRYENKNLISRLNADEASILFINTTALHRGGYGIEERLTANLSFASLMCEYVPRHIST